VTPSRPTLAVLVALAACRPALAQVVADRPVHRFEASVGGLWLGGAALGSGDAALRRNSLPVDEFPLFSADTSVEASPGFDGRVAFWLTRAFALEAGFVMMRPVVQTSITGDIEEAEGLTLEEKLDQYFFEASAVLLLERFRLGDRTIPFVSGGAGYLRQLHEGQTLVESGQVYHVGGGIRHWLRLSDRGFLRAAGVRADARAYFLVNGFALDDDPRPHGAFSGSLFLTF
jgi:hypothetical protein